MFKKAVFPGKYIQGVGAIGELPALIGSLGGRGLILASPSVHDKVLPRYGLDWGTRGVRIEVFGGECCEEELGRLSAVIAPTQANVIVGMGGGKAIDTAKIAADRAGLPVIVVPTIASTDAPTSGCAVIYSRDGVFDSVCYQRMNPAAVLVDLGIIAAAPTRFLVAGMGDALSTWFEARSCERTHSPNECGGYGTAAGFAIARLCYETLLSHGAAAKRANDSHLVTPVPARHVTHAFQKQSVTASYIQQPSRREIRSVHMPHFSALKIHGFDRRPVCPFCPDGQPGFRSSVCALPVCILGSLVCKVTCIGPVELLYRWRGIQKEQITPYANIETPPAGRTEPPVCQSLI